MNKYSAISVSRNKRGITIRKLRCRSKEKDDDDYMKKKRKQKRSRKKNMGYISQLFR